MSDEERQAMRRRYFERYGVAIEVDPKIVELQGKVDGLNREMRAWEMRFRDRLYDWPQQWDRLCERYVKPTQLPWSYVDAPADGRYLASIAQRCTSCPRSTFDPYEVREINEPVIIHVPVFYFVRVGVERGVHYWLGQCASCTKVLWCRTHGP